jgi:lipopolysaccharide/colanic/teichoic acid biosynthesis glycosyltransferase
MPTKLSTLASRGHAAAMINPGQLQPADDLSLESAVPESASAPLVQKQFRRILCHERKRSERSRKQFLLMLVRVTSPRLQNRAAYLPHRVSAVLGKTIRDTDILGWFEADSVNGVLFSELGAVEACAATKVIEAKVNSAFEMAFDANLRSKLEVDFYTFPEDRQADGYKLRIDPELYPDVFDLDEQKRTSLIIKRIIDVLGSVSALVLFSPIFLLLAMLIKLTSKGPVFFRQERLGQCEVPFTFLKFRSMRVATDAEIHRKYIKNFIAGRAEPHVSNGNRRLVYKITNDPRVTWIGRFMRRTSLDEMPQFWNVLMGEMSLVGPRPPIRYELEAYDLWHRRRLLEVKPGITGLWQIHGRSRTTFDEMVRLDLRYAKMWSPLTDIKILLQTPRAVFSGDGAY